MRLFEKMKLWECKGCEECEVSNYQLAARNVNELCAELEDFAEKFYKVAQMEGLTDQLAGQMMALAAVIYQIKSLIECETI